MLSGFIFRTSILQSLLRSLFSSCSTEMSEYILFGNLKGIYHLVKLGIDVRIILKKYFIAIYECEVMDGYLVHDRNQWQSLVKTEIWFPHRAENML